MKKYFVKIYQPNGSYINTLSDVTFNGFTKLMNGGLGNCGFTLARKIDDFKELEEIYYNYRVEIYVIDKDTSSEGKKIYSGFIISYNPFIDGKKEGINFSCMGYWSKLTSSILKNGTAIEITYNSTDPAIMIKNIIDRYRIETNNPIINYTNQSITGTGTTTSYTFNSKTYAEAIEKSRQMSPSGFYYYLDTDNILHFDGKPSLASHTFILGKHFKSINVEKTMDSVFNKIIFGNGDSIPQIFKLYSDSNSISLYDDRWLIEIDGRVTSSTTADAIGNWLLTKNKDPKIKTTIEIIDNNDNESGYDIESIEPGQTCRILNVNSQLSSTFTDNMVITKIDYNLDSAKIELESEKADINLGNKIKELSDKIIKEENKNNPTNYT